MIGRAPGTVRGLLKQWDAVANLSFCEVRSRIARITAANLARLPDTPVISFAQFRRGPIAATAIYAFIDDDDWFAPTLPMALAHTPIDNVGVIWRESRLDGHLNSFRAETIVGTNNYAVTGAALIRDLRLRRLAEQHFTLHDALSRQLYDMDYIDLPLSMTNKHPASTVMLEFAAKQFGAEGAMRALQDSKARYAEPVDLAAHGLEWAGSEVQAMRDLVAML